MHLVLCLSAVFFVFLMALMTVWLNNSDNLPTLVYVACEAGAAIFVASKIVDAIATKCKRINKCTHCIVVGHAFLNINSEKLFPTS